MGLFGNKNKYDIALKPEDCKSLVTKLGKDVIKINAKLIVPDGYVFVLGKTGKVTDIFEFGEYYFSYSNLPETCRKFHIDKIVDGRQCDKFTANLYLIDKSLHKGEFKSYRKVEMGTKAYGFFSVGVNGTYTYRVINTKELMQSLLNEFDYIRTGEAEDIIASWIDEIVVNELEKQNFIISDVIANDPRITECIKNKVIKLFRVAGLELVELKITKYNLPKKYQAESDNNIARNEQESKTLLNTNFNKENEESEPQESTNKILSDLENAEDQELKTTPAEFDYVPFGNFKITNGKKPDNTYELKPEKNFVDLSLDSLYNTSANKTKRCLNCGTENDFSADHCIICGEKLE